MVSGLFISLLLNMSHFNQGSFSPVGGSHNQQHHGSSGVSDNYSVQRHTGGEFSGTFSPVQQDTSANQGQFYTSNYNQGQFSNVGSFSAVPPPSQSEQHQHHEIPSVPSQQAHHHQESQHHSQPAQVHQEPSRSVSHDNAFGPLDDALDQIIAIASGLKGKIGSTKEVFNAELESRESNAKKVHSELEQLQEKLNSTSYANKEERDRLEQQISTKEAEQRAKIQEYDVKVQAELDARERAEREREAARGDADKERSRVSNLLKDLEEDASGYERLRPSRPQLNDEDTAILRQLFLSSSVSGSGKFSFSDLKQVLAKYADSIPDGPLKKLFVMVENDSKGRMSYITLVAVANDLAALVGDFRKIDTNSNDTLSRKEFRDHFVKLKFDKKSVQDALFRYADSDESDNVTFHEYVVLSLCLLVLRILFAFADTDKSGQLSRDEVKRVLDDAHIPEKAMKKFDHQYATVDVDDSKSLSYQEFVMLVLLMFHDD